MEHEQLMQRMRIQFEDPSLFDLALIHKSAVNEELASADNERLEFLGDAVLGAAVAGLLYETFPDASEGALTNMRAQLVRQSSLAVWARGFGLAEHILLGHGEEERGGRDRDGLMASTFEAILGALYLDQGYAAVQAFVTPLVERTLPTLSFSPRPRDPKSELQYRVQSRWGTLPSYRVVEVEGPEHRPTFTVEVRTEGERTAIGRGGSRQAAEQDAAQRLLDLLEAECS